MNTEKDYSLLRPFDLEAAERGDFLTNYCDDGVLWSYVTGPDKSEKYVLLIESGYKKGEFTLSSSSNNLRMAPLYWVEGKPVYRGDVLYGKSSKEKYVAAEERAIPENTNFRPLPYDNSHDGFTWTPPKAKRTVKLLAWFDGKELFWRREDAPCFVNWQRVPAKDTVIEIEEP